MNNINLKPFTKTKQFPTLPKNQAYYILQDRTHKLSQFAILQQGQVDFEFLLLNFQNVTSFHKSHASAFSSNNYNAIIYFLFTQIDYLSQIIILIYVS